MGNHQYIFVVFILGSRMVFLHLCVYTTERDSYSCAQKEQTAVWLYNNIFEIPQHVGIIVALYAAYFASTNICFRISLSDPHTYSCHIVEIS